MIFLVLFKFNVSQKRKLLNLNNKVYEQNSLFAISF